MPIQLNESSEKYMANVDILGMFGRGYKNS